MEDLESQDSHDSLSFEPASSAVETAEMEVANSSSMGIYRDVIEQAILPLLVELRELRQDFDTKIKYDESKERQVDSLHRELQSYREGLHFKIYAPSSSTSSLCMMILLSSQRVCHSLSRMISQVKPLTI